jgi:Sec-independent protein translocase protein TatA
VDVLIVLVIVLLVLASPRVAQRARSTFRSFGAFGKARRNRAGDHDELE